MAHTILVVDDAVSTRALLRAYFETRGCVVVEAGDGGEAFAVAMKNRPDLIVMDMEMPNIPGMTATHVFRELTETAGIPIILYTGNEESKATRALTFGPRLRYLHKTGDLSELWDMASKMLSGSESR